MNKQRRAAISKIAGQVSDLLSEVESIRDDEQEAFEGMPENLQDSDRGQASAAAVEGLEAAMSSLEDAISSLEESSAD